MTQGASLEQASQKIQPGVSQEIILYRTQSEILTDQRIIMQGKIYPLAQIAKTYVRPAWYYVPFLIVRLLMVTAAALLLLSFLSFVRGIIPVSAYLHLLGTILFVAIAYVMRWIPASVLLIETVSGQKDVFMRGNASYLQDITETIAAAVRAQQQETG